MHGSRTAALVLCGSALALMACADRSRDAAARTTKGTYDKTTGKLTELTYDRNRNGIVDTWTDMDGSRPLRSRMDQDEDGKIDRWEYYDEHGALTKVGFSRKHDGKPDSWAFSRPDGSLEHVDVSSASDERKIDRREFYQGDAMVRVEEDTNADGRADAWETYEKGALKTAEFDEDRDGKPDRRLTYVAGQLASIESQPDGSGHYQKKDAVQQ